MSYQLQDPPLALPYGYTYDPGFQSNHQFFLTNKDQNKYDKQISFQPNNQEISNVIFENSPQRARIFDQPLDHPIKKGLSQSKRVQSTPGKRHRIFDENSQITVEHIKPVSNSQQQILHQLQQQIEITKTKAQLYSGSYKQLLQRLVQLIENNQGNKHVSLLPEFNDTMFKIRNLEGLDMIDKIQVEKIVSQITKQDEKLTFQELLKQQLPKDWIFWVEPLYIEIQRQELPQSQWKNFIMSQKQLYNV